jgi:O-acetylhomoserine (thiol)-lyase
MEGGAAALALASGTAAIYYAVITVCKSGDEILSAGNLYGGTYTMFNNILPQFGIKTRFVNAVEPSEYESAINENTKLIFTETIGNPTLDVADIRGLAEVAHSHSIPLVVDSTFTTPALLRPIDYGADIVVHSLTKWMGGHGTAIGGVVIDSGRFDWRHPHFPLFTEPDSSYHDLRWAYDLGDLNHIAFIMRMRLVPLRNLGACIAPDNAWLFLQGMETLSIRMERHSSNALAVATYLSKHSKIEWVRYPGLPDDLAHKVARQYLTNGYGGMIVFGIRGGRKAGQRFVDSLRFISNAANVGDAKTLVIHPGSTTHSQLNEEEQVTAGVRPELIRLSVGLENVDDIIWDIDQALQVL